MIFSTFLVLTLKDYFFLFLLSFPLAYLLGKSTKVNYWYCLLLILILNPITIIFGWVIYLIIFKKLIKK